MKKTNLIRPGWIDQDSPDKYFKPIRVQRKRTKGWRMPANTICVTRPGKWSNPFKVDEYTSQKKAVEKFRDCVLNNTLVFAGILDLNQANIVYSHFKYISENLGLLRGKNVACFCKLSDSCHGDVLLELANK